MTTRTRYDADEPSFLQKAQRAVPDDVMRDIVADRLRRGLPSASAVVSSSARAPEPAAPSYQEWCKQRLGVDWPYERARDYYLTKKTAGVDVGPINAGDAPSVGRGWVDPPKLADWRPPGINIIDRMLDQQDALDRRDLERKLGGGK